MRAGIPYRLISDAVNFLPHHRMHLFDLAGNRKRDLRISLAPRVTDRPLECFRQAVPLGRRLMQRIQSGPAFVHRLLQPF